MREYEAADALLEAEAVLPRDAALVPLAPRHKKPLVEAWTAITSSQRRDPGFRALFRGEVGVGLLCGVPSGGICMVDLDRDDLVVAAEEAFAVLCQAPRIHGARGAKWLVRVGEPTAGFALRDRRGRKIGEFLGERQQGVVAGIHPVSRQSYRWHRQGKIPVVKASSIAEAFSLQLPPTHD